MRKKKSDYFLCNSKISKKFIKNYNKFIDKNKILEPINTSIFLNNYTNSTKKFKDRSIDILYASSNLKRDVKNFKFAVEIFDYLNNFLSLDFKIVVVGANFKSEKRIHGVKYMGVLTNKNLMKIMSNTKLVINTSYFDASPNLITEAIHNGCNILVSNNCGWSEIYNKKMVCNDVYSVKDWVDKITYLLKNKIYVDLDKKTQEKKFESILKGIK